MKSVHAWLLSALALGLFCFSTSRVLAVDDLLITEFMAQNDNTTADDDGDFSDWIELYNAGTNGVNLNGWFLTDSPDNPSSWWRFPSTNLPINQFIVVFASGKDRRIPGRQLHTNFKLNSSGDYLALVKPDGITIASVYPTYPLQVGGISYGIPVTLSTTTLLSTGSPAKFTVPLNDALGASWTAPDFNDASWISVNNGVGFEGGSASATSPQLLADSVAEFSGNQGSNGWFYGYWDKKADADGQYGAADFKPFPRGTGSILNSTNYFDGSKWDIPAGNPPFTEITATGMYPSADNGNPALPTHWAIRRYVAEAAGPLRISGLISSWNTNGTCGDGVIARIIVDGTEVWERAVFFTSEAYSIVVNANLGSTIDFAVDAQANDLCDATTFTAQVRTAAGNSVVADTIADWSASGTQGENSWSYGWFNRTVDPLYGPTDFIKFPSGAGPHSSANFWNGAAWQWFDGDPPFDLIGEVVMRPSQFTSGGTNGNIHWVIRRWISEVSGTLQIDWHASKQDTAILGVGNFTASVYQNAVQRDTVAVTGSDFVGALRTLTLAGVQVGDAIDFVIAPGTAGDNVIGRCFLNAVIHGSGSLSNQFVSDVGGLMTNINSSAFLRIPFNVPDVSVISGLTLRMKYDDGFVAYLNGTPVASANAPETPVWNSTATSARPDADASQFQAFNLDVLRDFLVNGNNVLAIQGLNLSAADNDFLLAAELLATRATLDVSGKRYFATPTPGALNGVGTTTLGPLITKVKHEPAEPSDTEDLVVSAKVTPTRAGVTNVSLYYRVMYGPETSVQMVDDGLHGDGAAGDGIFGATIPNTAYTSGQMVRYYFVARDSANSQSRQPPIGDTNNSSLYFGTVVKDPTLTNSLPVLHWFTPATVNSTAFVRASLYWQGELYDSIKMNIHGQSSFGFPNHSYNLDFNPDHHFRWDANSPRVDDVNLLSSYADKAHMRVMLSYGIHGSAGARSPSHFAVPVRMQSNGVFHSIMHIVENGDANYAKRLGRDPNGALYKMYTDPSVPANAEKKTRRFEDKSDFVALVSGINSATNRIFIYDNVDVSEAINFFAAMIITANVDCCHKNFYLYRDSDGDREWEMMPWDVDLSFGRNWQSAETYWDDRVYPNNGLFVGQTFPLGPYLFNANTSTRAMYLRRVRTLQDEMLQTNGTPAANLNFERQIDSWTSLMTADGALDLAKWGTWGGGNGGSGGGGTRIDNPTNQYYRTLPQSVQEMKTNYLVNRRKFVFDQKMGNAAEFPDTQPTNAVILIGALDYNPASGNQNEEYIQLINTNAYSVDISGWKLSGAIDHTFQGGVVIARAGLSNMLYVVANKPAFRARALSPHGGQGLYIEGPYNGQLSARGETIFLTDTKGRVVTTNLYLGNPSGPQQYLRITEIMYHPPKPPAGSPYDAEEFEYIEFRNTGPTNINLAGVHISNGVDFTFPSVSLAAGGYILVVRNLAAFTARYGAGLNVAGQFSGILDNSGENIRLDDAIGEKILDFSYNNSWYPFTDGPGASLVIRNDSADWRTWDLKDSWRPSAFDFGSPGLADGTPVSVLPVLVNEALTQTDPPLVDAIELFNPNPTTVDLSGWYLTDDFASPKKYQIPAGTTIAGGAYRIFYETNSFATGPNPFSLSSKGDETYLFSGNGANVTGFFDGFGFGAADSAVSFGRYVNSQTNTHFVAQSANTLGAANARPKVGPVVISEINYRPVEPSPGVDNDIDEYIELANITGSPVPLFDPGNPANTWRLRSAVDFDFPPNTTLAAGGHILLVSFNPGDQPALAIFRAHYSVSPSVPVFGPFSGQLGNTGESIRLYKPGPPDPTSLPVVPYILVDQVDYANQLPWPAAADGIGPSLQRRVESAYGNDPTNWIAVGPSAGSAFVPGGSPPTILSQPTDTVGLLGRTVQFSVNVSGTPPFLYRWRKNGLSLDAQGQVLTLNNVQLSDSATYSVIVFNSAGSIESTPARLTVLAPVSISGHPQPLKLRGSTNTADYGFTTNNATFSVAAVGTGTLRYQWRYNGANIAGANGQNYTVNSVGLAQEGLYDVVVDDDISTTTSTAARLTVLVTPVYLLTPLNQVIVSNGTFTVSGAFHGNPAPFRVEWREISTVRSSNLTAETITIFTSGPITNKLPNLTNTWRLVVFNDAAPNGVPVSFSVVALADADGDRIPDEWEAANGFDPNNPANALLDSDGDGMNNLSEYLAGTDPNNPLSFLKIEQTVSPGQATVRFGAVANHTYTIRYTDALGGPWHKLADVLATSNNRVETIPDPTWTSSRFYQVITPSQPQP